MNTLEKRIQKALADTALSNSEIARRCNVARSTVGLWKDGHTIRSDNLTRLCQVLGIDDQLELPLRPQQKKVVRLVSSLQEEHDDVLHALEKLLTSLDRKQ
jgi:DNA-binding Xre family transcriptional regulator